MMKNEMVYEGFLSMRTDGEADDILHIGDDILSELIQDDIKDYGNYLSVRYFTSDEETTIDKAILENIKKISGVGDVCWGHRYSEVTGYLYTNNEIKVGGHDLLDELEGYVGKYLILIIDYYIEVDVYLNEITGTLHKDKDCAMSHKPHNENIRKLSITEHPKHYCMKCFRGYTYVARNEAVDYGSKQR